MSDEKQPTRIQFQIGKTASLDLQEWIENQSLNPNKAVKEALEQFVRAYGTGDISSREVRSAMAAQKYVSPPTHSFNTPGPQVEAKDDSISENEAARKEQPKKKITARDIDI